MVVNGKGVVEEGMDGDGGVWLPLLSLNVPMYLPLHPNSSKKWEGETSFSSICSLVILKNLGLDHFECHIKLSATNSCPAAQTGSTFSAISWAFCENGFHNSILSL